MHRTLAVAASSLVLLGACERSAAPAPIADRSSAAGGRAPSGVTPTTTGAAVGWELLSSGEGSALVFPATGAPAIRLFCPADGKRLLVNVPGFRAVGSEERLSVGSGGAAEALVADSRGDRQRGGVSGAGAVPANLAALIAGPVSASYGAQKSGPHPAPPPGLAREFVLQCNEAAAPVGEASPTGAAPCLVQDGKPLTVAPLRAVGTEPFWGARIEGRCVTYSHPDDQNGTRVWTRYAASATGASWTGSLGGKPFVLTTRARPGCSDGMSDKRYLIAVTLLVAGEERTGCAEPR